MITANAPNFLAARKHRIMVVTKEIPYYKFLCLYSDEYITFCGGNKPLTIFLYESSD